jgi:hypothetical protein
MNFSFNLGMSGCTIIGVVFILIFRFFFVGDFRGSAFFRLVYFRLGLIIAEGATIGIFSTICALGIGGWTIGGSTICGWTIGGCFRVYLRFIGLPSACVTASTGASTCASAGATIRFVYLRFGASGSRFLYVRFGFGTGSIFIIYNRTINFLLLNYNGKLVSIKRIAFRSNFIRTLRCIFGLSAIHAPRSDTVC